MTPTDPEVSPDYRCEECGRRARESRFQPGHFYDDHSGDCSQNSALQVCDRCGHRHVDRDFGQVLACVMDVPLEEGRAMQKRICDRLEGATTECSDDPFAGMGTCEVCGAAIGTTEAECPVCRRNGTGDRP